MLRVLHIFKTYFPERTGGIQEVIRSICLLTRKFGYEHTVLTVAKNPNPINIEIDGVHIVRERSLIDIFSCPIGGRKMFAQMKALTSEHDIVIYHFPWPFGDLLSLASNGVPSIVLYHSDIVKQKKLGFLYGPLMKYFLSKATTIVATSEEYVKTSLVLQHYQKKIKIIPLTAMTNSVPEDGGILKRYNLINQKYVLFVGVLRYYKGLEYLIRAARKLDVPVVIAGDGDQRSLLEQLKQELNAKNVYMTGVITEAEKKALMRHASVFAFPSCLRSEAYGVSLVEATMYGIPMVTCEIGTGTSFVNRHEKTGFVVPPCNPDELARAIRRIIIDEDLNKRMRECSRMRWVEELSPDRFAESWARCLQSVIKRK